MLQPRYTERGRTGCYACGDLSMAARAGSRDVPGHVWERRVNPVNLRGQAVVAAHLAGLGLSPAVDLVVTTARSASALVHRSLVVVAAQALSLVRFPAPWYRAHLMRTCIEPLHVAIPAPAVFAAAGLRRSGKLLSAVHAGVNLPAAHTAFSEPPTGLAAGRLWRDACSAIGAVIQTRWHDNLHMRMRYGYGSISQ